MRVSIFLPPSLPHSLPTYLHPYLSPSLPTYLLTYLPTSLSLPTGPCHPGTCSNPGQVCQAGQDGQALCACPDCVGRPDEPVCALVGNVVRTYDNECLVRRTACELTKQLAVLEQRACEG